MRNSDMVNFINGIQGIKDKRLPVKIGYAITRNLKTLEPVASAYEEERNKILRRYTEESEDGEVEIDGKRYRLKDREDYQKELVELLSIDCKAELLVITLEDLEKCDSSHFESLSANDISILEVMTKYE